MLVEMPKKSRIDLPPVKFGKDESLGQRLARLRKERGITQVELAERIGTIQVLVSNYERDRIRLNAEMVVRIAQALEITTDELLGMKEVRPERRKKTSRKIQRRVERIEDLPPQQQTTLLRTIDTFLKASGQ